MSKSICGLILTFALSIFMLVGCLLAFVINHKKKKVMDFIFGLAFSVIIMLILTDLLPEVYECLGFHHFYLFFLFLVIGFLLLRILDHYIPDHDDHKLTRKEEKNNYIHIGVVSSIALVLHNIIEGMAVYSTTISNSNAAALMSLGIGLHNVPLGMVIASVLYQDNQSKKKTAFILFSLSLSTFVGGIIMAFLHSMMNGLVTGCLLSLTVGMLLFIAFHELLPSVKKSKNKKTSCYGILLGILLLLISLFL